MQNDGLFRFPFFFSLVWAFVWKLSQAFVTALMPAFE
jgi:hypothetical protein